jgi:hypothetical protein
LYDVLYGGIITSEVRLNIPQENEKFWKPRLKQENKLTLTWILRKDVARLWTKLDALKTEQSGELLLTHQSAFELTKGEEILYLQINYQVINIKYVPYSQ